MLTILFEVTVNEGLEEEFADLAKEMMRSTHALDEGCITFVWHRQPDDPRKFVLYEQWRDEPAVNAHLARLIGEIGRERFFGYFEKTSAQRLELIE
jgi:quinol monooxygenase YgiN